VSKIVEILDTCPSVFDDLRHPPAPARPPTSPGRPRG
jgi:hypothetical protein